MESEPTFNEATEAQDRMGREAELAAMRQVWNARHPAAPAVPEAGDAPTPRVMCAAERAMWEEREEWKRTASERGFTLAALRRLAQAVVDCPCMCAASCDELDALKDALALLRAPARDATGGET